MSFLVGKQTEAQRRLDEAQHAGEFLSYVHSVAQPADYLYIWYRQLMSKWPAWIRFSLNHFDGTELKTSRKSWFEFSQNLSIIVWYFNKKSSAVRIHLYRLGHSMFLHYQAEVQTVSQKGARNEGSGSWLETSKHQTSIQHVSMLDRAI